jgi:hypothetical protein
MLTIQQKYRVRGGRGSYKFENVYSKKILEQLL